MVYIAILFFITGIVVLIFKVKKNNAKLKEFEQKMLDDINRIIGKEDSGNDKTG